MHSTAAPCLCLFICMVICVSFCSALLIQKCWSESCEICAAATFHFDWETVEAIENIQRCRKLFIHSKPTRFSCQSGYKKNSDFLWKLFSLIIESHKWHFLFILAFVTCAAGLSLEQTAKANVASGPLASSFIFICMMHGFEDYSPVVLHPRICQRSLENSLDIILLLKFCWIGQMARPEPEPLSL